MTQWTIFLKDRADVTANYARHQACRSQESHMQSCEMEPLKGGVGMGGEKKQEGSMNLKPFSCSAHL